MANSGVRRCRLGDSSRRGCEGNFANPYTAAILASRCIVNGEADLVNHCLSAIFASIVS